MWHDRQAHGTRSDGRSSAMTGRVGNEAAKKVSPFGAMLTASWQTDTAVQNEGGSGFCGAPPRS